MDGTLQGSRDRMGGKMSQEFLFPEEDEYRTVEDVMFGQSDQMIYSMPPLVDADCPENCPFCLGTDCKQCDPFDTEPCQHDVGERHELPAGTAGSITYEAPATIDQFVGKYEFLSNFFPTQVHLDDVDYPTVEHAYQAAKTPDDGERQQIRSAKTPAQAKRLGQKVLLRENWDVLKLEVMRALLVEKFSHSDNRAKLEATSPAMLIEGNVWGDEFWGVCKGIGQNNLGLLLMQIRDGWWEDRTGDDPLATTNIALEAAGLPPINVVEDLPDNTMVMAAESETPGEPNVVVATVCNPPTEPTTLDALAEMANRALADLANRKRPSTPPKRLAGPPSNRKKPANACTCATDESGALVGEKCNSCRQMYWLSIDAYEDSLSPNCPSCGGEVVHEEGCKDARRQEMLAKIFDGEPIVQKSDEATICYLCHQPIERGVGAIVTTAGTYHMRSCLQPRLAQSPTT